MTKIPRSVPLLAVAFVAATYPATAPLAESFMNGRSYYGEPAAASAPARAVDIASTTRVTARYGETIVFRNAGRQFAWTFNGLDRRTIDLSRIAPKDFASRPLTIYILEDPNTLP